jgi:hypothetical protein
MIAFSMTDETYAEDMLHEVYEMNDNCPWSGDTFLFSEMDVWFIRSPLRLLLQIAVLATLAKMTNRILILPQVLGDFHAQPLWIYLDLESLEKNGTVYREANFAYNKKSWYSHTKPFECVTQMAIVESSNEIQLLTTADGIITTAFSDRIPLSTFAPDDPLTAVFAVASAHPDAKQSEALFVNLAHFQDGRGNLDEVHKL